LDHLWLISLKNVISSKKHTKNVPSWTNMELLQERQQFQAVVALKVRLGDDWKNKQTAILVLCG
jgi:hypothetical protein